MLFLFCRKYSTKIDTAAYKKQCHPHYKIFIAAGFRRFFIVRQFFNYGIRLGNFIGCRGVAVIFSAAFAVPIFNIAIRVLSCRLCVYMLDVGVIVCIKLSVRLTADFAYRFFCAGGFSAGAIFGFKAFSAVHRAFMEWWIYHPQTLRCRAYRPRQVGDRHPCAEAESVFLRDTFLCTSVPVCTGGHIRSYCLPPCFLCKIPIRK